MGIKSVRVWIGILSVAVLASMAWGVYQYRQNRNLSLAQENGYRRAFHDLADHLDRLETDLAKSGVASTVNQRVYYLSAMSGSSDAALKDLAQLPATQTGISYVGQLLTQSGDFSRNLALRLANGGTATSQDEKLINDIHERVLTANRQVQDLVVRVDNEQLAWTTRSTGFLQRLGYGRPAVAEAAAEGGEGAPASVGAGLDQLDAGLQKLPPFDYSGEYARRTVTAPKWLPATEVTKEQAQGIARDFLAKVGLNGTGPEFNGEIRGSFAGYQFKQGDATLDVSKKGGVITVYRYDRVTQPRALSVPEAQNKAMATLKALGYDLVLSSTEDYGSYLGLEAVAEKDGVRIYPDKVRMSVAMDNGQLTAIDSTPYWSFHQDRTINRGKLISLDDAKRKLRPNFQVRESRLAIITVQGDREVLSYEFRGNYQGEDYLLYLNSSNGTEEKIRRIITTPRGEYLQ